MRTLQLGLDSGEFCLERDHLLSSSGDRRRAGMWHVADRHARKDVATCRFLERIEVIEFREINVRTQEDPDVSGMPYVTLDDLHPFKLFDLLDGPRTGRDDPVGGRRGVGGVAKGYAADEVGWARERGKVRDGDADVGCDGAEVLVGWEGVDVDVARGCAGDEMAL